MKSVLCIFIFVAMTACSSVQPGYEVKNGTVYFITVYEDMGMPAGSSKKPIRADAKTFKSLGSGAGSGVYGKDKNSVFYRGEILSGADPTTFRLIDDPENHGYYLRDKDSVYFGGVRLEGVDPNDFDVISSGAARTSDACYIGEKLQPLSDWCR